ncbi:MAG: hypothetical protein IPN23_10705 [Elusimicrobia bacterium]|nr:hypothetical protein [Elusimicrobiota bacterium]
MNDKSAGPTNPYRHEDRDDIFGCENKCKISAWDNGYAAGFKAGLELAAGIAGRQTGWEANTIRDGIRAEIEKI